MSAPPQPSFNEVIHSPMRLRITALLRTVETVEFSVIRDTLGLSDVNLSKNLKVLAEAGYVTVSKESSQARSDARRLTWVSLTTQGKSALEGHLAALVEIAGEAPST